MPVLLHGVSQCLSPRGRASEYLQLAAAIIVEPLDAPLAGGFAIFKDFGWFGHAGLLPMPGSRRRGRSIREKDRAGFPGRLRRWTGLRPWRRRPSYPGWPASRFT